MYQQTMGYCTHCTITSNAFTADFISTDESKPIKVWWNFGCIRFEEKVKVVTYIKSNLNKIFVSIFFVAIISGITIGIFIGKYIPN